MAKHSYTVAQGGKCSYKLRHGLSMRAASKLARRWSRQGPTCRVDVRRDRGPTTWSRSGTSTTILTCKRGVCERTGWV